MPGGDYRDALRERAGWQARARAALDADGERVGEHRGAAAYTVGQRQGLGVALGEPRYVSRIDPLTNTIQLGRREDLETRTFDVERASFVAGDRAAAAIPRERPDPPPRDADPGDGRAPAGDRRWTVPDRRAGLGGGARAGGRALRRRRGRSAAAGSRRGRRRLRGRRVSSRTRPSSSGVLVGIFNAALYVLIRGSAGGRLPLVVAAAILGAWAGDALGDRLGIDLLSHRRLPPGRRARSGPGSGSGSCRSCWRSSARRAQGVTDEAQRERRPAGRDGAARARARRVGDDPRAAPGSSRSCPPPRCGASTIGTVDAVAPVLGGAGRRGREHPRGRRPAGGRSGPPTRSPSTAATPWQLLRIGPRAGPRCRPSASE